MSIERYARFIRQAEESLDYHVAGAEIQFTEELCRAMEEMGVSRAELARRIESSPAYVTKVLRGTVNFTLETMVKLSRAVGKDLRLHLAARGSRTVWKDDGWCRPRKAQHVPMIPLETEGYPLTLEENRDRTTVAA